MRVNAIGSFVLPKNQFLKSTAIQNNFIKPIGVDTVSFTSETNVKPVNVDLETATKVANSLSTSTSGHRAKYPSEDFNPDIVRLVTLGVAKYAKDDAAKKGLTPRVIIGGDTRKATRESLPLIKDTLLKQGVDVLYIKEPVPTPLLALASKQRKTDISVLMTASHNPWDDGGYNLVTNDGAIAPASVTKKVADNMIEIAKQGTYTESSKNKGKEYKIYPYEEYKKFLNSHDLIDWDNLKSSGLQIYYESLQGTGSYVMPKLLKDYSVPFKEVKSSGQKGPNPTSENLEVLKQNVKSGNSPLKIGLANDGDADRFGVVDENGEFISANDVLLLVAHHLIENKGKTGAIVRNQVTSKQLDILAQKHNLDSFNTPVGFKYIGTIIDDLRKDGKDILIAGEESGGCTINGHIPEKDGIIATLLIADLVATEQKPVSQILKEIKTDLGVNVTNLDFKKELDENKKNIIMSRMEDIYNGVLEGKTDFGSNYHIDAQKTIQHQEDMKKFRPNGDGITLIFDEGSSVTVRKSGTEPIIKCYIQATGSTAQDSDENAKTLKSEMNEIFNV